MTFVRPNLIFISPALLSRWCCIVLIATFCNAACAATATINGAQTYQVIDGFGVNANHRSWNTNELKPVLDALIDEAGMTMFRVLYDKADWEATNDNNNSSVMNWNYYTNVYGSTNFQRLWDMIAYLNQRGISNTIVLNFQGNGPLWMGGTNLTPGYEDEWAEMVASLAIYARNTRHLHFNLFSPDNEPDNGPDPVQGVQVSVSQYTNMMHKLALKLDTNGLSDFRFVAPDLAYGDGTNWLPELMANPLIMSKMAYYGVHSYEANGGNSAGVLNFIQQSPYPDIRFWVTEFNTWCSTCESCGGGPSPTDWTFYRGTAEYLLGHLGKDASAGMVWEGFDSFYRIRNCWSYWGLLAVDNINATPKTYTRRKNFYTMAQFSKFIRPGARRIALNGSLSPLSLLAFYHQSLGQLSLVGVNTSGSQTTLSATLTNLPLFASLDLYYTSSTTNLYHSATVAVTNRSFSRAIPADCVFTLTGFTFPTISVSSVPTNDLQLVVVSWNDPLTNYTLEGTAELNPPSWSAVTNTPQQNATQRSVTLVPVDQQRFFRLHLQ